MQFLRLQVVRIIAVAALQWQLSDAVVRADQVLSTSNDLPTIEEVIAGYQQNTLLIERLRIIYSMEEEYYQDYRRQLQERLDGLASQKDGQKDKTQGESLDQAIQRAIQEIHAFKPDVLTQSPIEVWKVARSIQIRLPPLDIEMAPQLSSQTLAKEFHHSTIISRSESMPDWHLWGGATQGVPKLTISNYAPLSAISMPPMLANTVVPESSWHSLDQLGDTDRKWSVVGREMINGRNLLIVDQTQAMNIAPISDFDRRLKVMLTYRIWVDEQAGFWPRRRAYSSQYFLDGVKVDNPISSENGFPPTIDDVEIELLPGGGYYPTKGVIRWWRVFPVASGPSMEDILLRGAARPKNRAVLIKETRWSAKVSIPDASPVFDLVSILPKETPIWKDGEFLVADNQGALIRSVAPVLSPQTGSRRWIRMATCVLALLAVTGAWWWSKRKG